MYRTHGRYIKTFVIFISFMDTWSTLFQEKASRAVPKNVTKRYNFPHLSVYICSLLSLLVLCHTQSHAYMYRIYHSKDQKKILHKVVTIFLYVYNMLPYHDYIIRCKLALKVVIIQKGLNFPPKM